MEVEMEGPNKYINRVNYPGRLVEMVEKDQIGHDIVCRAFVRGTLDYRAFTDSTIGSKVLEDDYNYLMRVADDPTGRVQFKIEQRYLDYILESVQV